MAGDLFVEQGYEQTSMEAIARRAGASKQTIYAHYPTKGDLFAAVFRRRADTFFSKFSQVLSGDASLEGGLRGFAEQLLEIVLDPQAKALRRLVIGETHRFPELGRTFFELGPGRCLGLLAEFLRKKAAAGEIQVSDAVLAAEQFASLVTAGTVWAAELGLLHTLSPEARAERVERAVAAFMKLYALR
jgi:AcrR family transcriptional regulator